MKKFISYAVVLLVGLGFGFLVFHNGAQPKVGGLINNLTTHFINGFYAGSTDQLSVSSAGAVTTTGAVSSASFTATGAVSGATYGTASVGFSSSSPAALGSAASGFFTIGTSTPAYRYVNASTTAVTANSLIFLEQTATTTALSLTCNTTMATGTMVTTKIAGSGFTVWANSVPATNPNCYNYWILN